MNKKGFILSLVLIFLLILVLIATTFIVLTNNEIRIARQQTDSLRAFYLAEAGIEKALFELAGNRDYTGEKNTLGEGVYDVSVSPPNGVRQIDSTGYIPNETSPRAVRQIRVRANEQTHPITLGAALTGLTSGNDIWIRGTANIDGKTVAGIEVPDKSVIDRGGGATISGNPDILEEVPPATFEEIFGLTEAEMKAFATVYTNPGNNFPDPANGITWIDGDANYTKKEWSGSGILIVTGDLKLTGGTFRGVIYVKGSLDGQAGNSDVRGGIVMGGEARISGTSSIIYDSTEITNAGNSYPYKIDTWQEVR